jgi:lysophospholipase L1-like esterase
VVTRFISVIQGQQVVLLMEGSNDVNAGIKDSTVLNDTLFNLQRMLRAAKSAGVMPFIATIPPMTGSGRGVGASLVSGFNDRVRLLASAEGVTLVDVHNAFGGDLSLIGADGLHLNQSGYQRVADTFLESIEATLEQAPALTPSSGWSRPKP